MRIKLVSLLVVLLASSTVTSVSLAEAPTDHQSQTNLSPQQMGQASSANTNIVSFEQSQTTVTNIAALVETLAQITEFADWEQGQALPIRTLFDPSGHPNALLWKVESGGAERGYIVSTLDGGNAYEFSHHAVPEVPESLQSKMVDNGYVYAGPMLHLAYIHGLDGLELYNLLNGETLPTGELQDRLPKSVSVQMGEKDQNAQFAEHLLKRSTAPEDDALYATGLYGTYKLGTQKGIHPLQEYAKRDAFEKPSFVVYDAIPDKMTVPLAMTKIVKHGTVTFVGLQNPFVERADEQLPVYIDSRFPVFVVP